MLLLFNRALLESGYNARPRREWFCGDRWWKLNMTACGVVGDPIRLLSPMGSGCGKTIGGDGESFPNL
jgi:hypothetical protein